MQTTYFGDSNQYAILTADEGYWLTTWNEADDISTFNAFKTVRLLSGRAGLFHEVNYPRTKDSWASDFIADYLRVGLMSAPSV